MFNKAIMAGNLTKDPELRYTPAGIPVTALRLAVTTKKKVNQQYQDETLFIDAVVFGKRAESVSQHLSKGSGVLVEGRLSENRWEKDGVTQRRIEIVADNVTFLPKKGGSGTQQFDAPPEELTDTEEF